MTWISWVNPDRVAEQARVDSRKIEETKMSFPETVCRYYGRLFLETYSGADDLNLPSTYIDETMEAVVIEAAKFAKAGNPGIQQAVCSCDYFAHESRFMGMLLKFKCPVHGEMTLDRKIVSFPVTLTDTVTTPALPQPYQPYQPTWTNAPCPPSVITANGGLTWTMQEC